jgi:hypothetical protein
MNFTINTIYLNAFLFVLLTLNMIVTIKILRSFNDILMKIFLVLLVWCLPVIGLISVLLIKKDDVSKIN